MINHARTLLLNRSGAGYVARLGEEFIPPKFRPVLQSSAMDAVRRVLFGYKPDWLLENYRARQYLALLHNTELLQFVTDLDPRLTYDVNNDDLFGANIFGTWADDPDTIRFVGIQPAPDESGQAFRRWRVEIVGSDRVRVTRLGLIGSNQEFAFTTDGTWSSLVPLGSAEYFVSFQAAPGIWTIDDVARPVRSLGEIVAAAAQIPDARLAELFGELDGRVAVEPWKTFRNLWSDHPELPYRLGGLLLALIYRAEDRRLSSAQ